MAVNYEHTLLTPLLEDPTGSTVISNGPQGRRKRPWRTVAAPFYILFLCWQLTGMFLYAVRVIVCFKRRSLTYKCDPNAGFQHSADFEFVWLTTRSLHIIVVLTVLKKICDCPGFKTIIRQLKVLPEFWTLVCLLLMAMCRYAMLLTISGQALSHIIISYVFCNILRVTSVGILNFTELETIRHNYPIYVFIFSKLTLVTFFLENLLNFVVSLLQFAENVEDFTQEEMKTSLDAQVIYCFLHKFATTYFSMKIASFFWQKLFNDDVNLLSSHPRCHTK